jgi:hypothetical protein
MREVTVVADPSAMLSIPEMERHIAFSAAGQLFLESLSRVAPM